MALEEHRAVRKPGLCRAGRSAPARDPAWSTARTRGGASPPQSTIPPPEASRERWKPLEPKGGSGMSHADPGPQGRAAESPSKLLSLAQLLCKLRTITCKGLKGHDVPICRGSAAGRDRWARSPGNPEAPACGPNMTRELAAASDSHDSEELLPHTAFPPSPSLTDPTSPFLLFSEETRGSLTLTSPRRGRAKREEFA